MKKKTKTQKLHEAWLIYDAKKHGQKPKRPAADGSIATHPIVPVPDLPESEVLAQCLKWLKARRIFCDRHDVGTGDLGYGYAQYGIKGAGDIIGILPNGRHFEIEIKAGKGGRLSTGQQKRMRDVRATGGVYLIVHGVFELESLMGCLI